MDITSSKVTQMKIIPIMDLAGWIESSMGDSFTVPADLPKEVVELIEQEPFLRGYFRNPNMPNTVPVKALLFLRAYTQYVVEGSLTYPGNNKVNLDNFIRMWNKQYSQLINLHRAEVGREINELRLAMTNTNPTLGAKMQYQYEIERLSEKYDNPPTVAMASMHRFDDKMDRLLADFKYDLKLFVGDNPWIMHRVTFRGQDIVIEKMEDYRILEWMKLHQNNALEAARTHYYKDKEAQ